MSNLVYLSSTLKDLGPYREAALEALRRAGYLVKDSFRASDEGTLQQCVNDVQACDIYVGIFGGCYGWRPDGPGGKSITEAEYDAALAKGRRCFIFTVTREHWNPAHADGINGRYDDAKAVDELHTRLARGQGHTLAPVTTPTDLGLKLTQALPPAALASGMFRAPPVHPRQLSVGLLLLGVRGSDEAAIERLRASLPATWQAATLLLSPEPSQAAADRLLLDQQVARSRCVALLLSPVGLARWSENPHVAQALPRLLVERLGSYALLCQDVAASTVPAGWPLPCASWPLGQWLAAGANVMGGELATLVQQLPGCSLSHRDVANAGLVSLAWSVLAMTATEAQTLVEQPELVRDELGKKTGEFFRTLTLQPAGVRPWPQRYGATRRDWQPYGRGDGHEDSPASIAALLDEVVQGINQQKAMPKRDHSALLGNEVRLRYYAFEPSTFQPGSADWPLIEAMRKRGCLVLVDELSTLHPALHGTANVFLADPAVTVATLSGMDPAACSLDDLIASPQKIDVLVDRFTNKLDPRCELAINSRARARRWLRQSVPEALAGIEAQGPDPDLRLAFRNNPGGPL